MISAPLHHKIIVFSLLLFMEMAIVTSHDDRHYEYIGKFVSRPKRYRPHKYRKGSKSSKHKCKKSKKKKKDKRSKSKINRVSGDQCDDDVKEDRNFNLILKVLFDDIIISTTQDVLDAVEAIEPIFIERANILAECYYNENTISFERMTFLDINLLDETVTEIIFSVNGDYSSMDEDICYSCVVGDSISRERRRRMEEEEIDSCVRFGDRGQFESELINTGLPFFGNLIDVDVRDLKDCANDYQTCTQFSGPFDSCIDPEIAVGCPQSCCCGFLDLERDHHATDSTTCSAYSQVCDECAMGDQYEYEYYSYDSYYD